MSHRKSGGFDRALGQVIDGARQSIGGLDKQFERLVLKGIGMDAHRAKPSGHVVARLGRLEPSQCQGEAES